MAIEKDEELIFEEFKNNSQDVRLIFTDSAFDMHKERNNLRSNKKRKFNATIRDIAPDVEELDRYDEFAQLRINPSTYERKDGEPYGIPYLPEVHGDGSQGVILPHQQSAALAFLKDLRGFGLLADVVGSGKTYEAGVVLSELAVRGAISSMLIVAPEQVYETWIKVLEMDFGMGKGALMRVGDTPSFKRTDVDATDGFQRLKRPVIVKMEDFAKWSDEMTDYLFDVIVVDEAHHLCDEDGEYAQAMYLLSMFMQTKKRANKTYCLLLSATPHSGNLEHMFRLWYFIRCKGGDPKDFKVQDDSTRTKSYVEEKKYYLSHICRGATTVLEFTKHVKIDTIKNKYKKEFSQFLRSAHKIDLAKFEAMSHGEQLNYVNEFIEENLTEEQRDDLTAEISDAYLNGVLEPIMIRRANNRKKKKNSVSVFLLPVKQPLAVLDNIQGVDGNVSINMAGLDGDEALHASGKSYSLWDYVRKYTGTNNRSVCQAYSEIMSHIFAAAQVGEANLSDPHKLLRIGAKSYYLNQIKNLPADMDVRFLPIPYEPNDSTDYAFNAKLAYLKKILAEYKNRRVIVFFDYELKENERVDQQVIDALSADKSFKKRLLIGTDKNKEDTLNAFNATEDAVLIATDAGYTEGANLQACNVMVNFQVTPDPLAMDQRIGRIARLGQTSDVMIYSLADMSRLEGYVLMYFNSIGLMRSDSGDATIIAGSNNDKMVTIRCPRCQNVKMFALEDYQRYVRDDSSEIYCKETELCVDADNPKGRRMREINTNEERCDTCGLNFRRSVADGGYVCMASVQPKWIMCNSSDQGDRRMYCNKICAMAHCSRFMEGGVLHDKCAVMKEAKYGNKKNVELSELVILCSMCKYKKMCDEKCRPTCDNTPDSIKACTDCPNATCIPAPHVIEFDKDWNAPCPVCGKRNGGRLKPVRSSTFASYIRALWNFEHDSTKSAFCGSLVRETQNVADLEKILSHRFTKEK